MNLDRKYSILRKIAVFVAINFLAQIFAPTVAFALTGGPSSPEFSSFEPVATTNMVSEFSGDLTYNLPVINVPGVNGGGYAMSLSYHSGTTPEEEASWVGYGWTLNPGAINRNKKGFPDDWKQDTVKYWNKTPANQTISVGGNIGNLEFFSANIPLSANSSIRYNNYKGFGYAIGAGISLGKGVVSLGYNISDGSGSFSLRVNPAAAMSGNKKKGKKGDKKTTSKQRATARRKAAISAYKDKQAGKTTPKTTKQKVAGVMNGISSGYGLHNFASASRPTQIVDYEGISTTVSLSVLAALSPTPIGPTLGGFGSYTRQKNTEESDLNVYGYMYSANAGGGDMMDYFIEKGSTYTKQDKFLGIPFNNADNYSLTGEGLGGGFKIHNKKAGTFHPNSNISVTNIINVGAEVNLGLNNGGGADIGVGHQELKVGEWGSPGTNNGFSVNEDESNIFRFANDMGGELSYDGGSTSAKQANVQMSGVTPGAKSATANTSAIIKGINSNSYGRSLRSSYIGYNTNGDIGVAENSVYYKAYAKGVDNHISNGSVDRSKTTQIGEFSIVNEDGARYNYGIPVLSKNEKNIQVDLNGISGSSIENKFLVYRDITGSTETKVGEERATAYATSYLLTGITSPDYIDRSNDGPTDDDFGGYTKFNYHRAYGGTGTWYKWRMPYAGLSYSRNQLSDPKDDLGSVAEGYKEMYYLDTVETKTHYAVFHISDRNDGLDAANSEYTASTSATAKGSNALKKLDKIELFAKNASGGSDKLIKTVHFKYDYSLCDGVLNNSTGGKLTLKKVWFEYNGAVDAKISPYQFEYKYPTTAQADYPTRYDAFEDYGSYTSSEQNPDYSPFNIDAWGNYQNDGAARFDDMKLWLNQNDSADSVATFDPAAWQLKVIKLPSGGEIHVQYEQDDYCYVQDQQAHAMVSLISSDHDDGYFTLNTSELGITTNAEAKKLAAIIRKEYAYGVKKIYFKMLYKLLGNSIPHFDDCNVEYITGYADVTDVTVSGTSVQVELSTGGYTLPKDVCEDYVTTQRAGMLTAVGSDCNPSEAVIVGGSPTQKVLGFFDKAAGWLASLAPYTTCLEINDEYSYLKVPLLYAKKGGGVRVKRLLMFDKGIDAGVPVLYGSEYIYKTFDNERDEYRSSGVATNEPGSIREENVLIGFMDRFKQSFWGKVVSGRDKKQSEGPLGESILPGASVGYSKIITKSIHSGKTNPGFAIKEFYTAKKYPVKMTMTEMDRDNKDYLPLITGLVNKITNNLWVSQGYAFEINSMHGKLRSSSTYAGDYSDILNPNASTLVSQEVMTYFQPGEELPILDVNDLSHTTTMPLGKEMDMVFESKFVKDISADGNLEMDANVGIFGIPVPFLSAFPTMTFTETELYTHTTTKIISYPAVLKSTKSYADGIYHLSENIAFNPETGKPIMTRTTDGFANLNLLASNNHNGDYTKYSFPASMEYENVSQIAKNERKTVNSNGTITIDVITESGKEYLSFSAVPPATVCGAMSNFVGGDLIKIPTGTYHTGDIAGSKIEIQPTYYNNITSGDVTAIDVEIVRSGRTNQLNAMAGSLTTYGKDSVIITPVDSATMALRQEFADLLTDAIDGTIDTILFEDIPTGIEFLNADGSCSALDSNYYIVGEGNQINIYGPGTPVNQDTVIVGRPDSTHYMVDTLNSYLNTFYDYVLDTTSATLECGSVTPTETNVIDVSNTSVTTMVSEQNTVLARVFSDVNGGTHAIDEYLREIGVYSGIARTTVDYSSSTIVNRRVALEEIATGKIMGANLECVADVGESYPEYCAGCTLNDMTDTTVCDIVDTVGIGQFAEDSLGYLIHEYGDDISCPTDIRFYKLEGGEIFPELICSSPLILSGGYGHFEIDPKTAALVYYAEDNDCYAQDVPCLRFCEEHYPSTAITNVVASEANTLNDHWDYNESLYSSTGNDYEKGTRGKWRTKRTYAFKTDVDRLTTSYDKNYNSGTYQLELFNWEILNANGQKWLELNTVNTYSPNGNALEEENILGIKSAAKFGYHKTLPYLIAQNAEYNSIMFESFENDYSGFLEDGIDWNSLDGSIDNNTSHSGNSSFKLAFPANDGVELTEMTVSSQILAKGMLFKTWIKTDFDDRTTLDSLLKAELRDAGSTLIVSEPFKKVAQVGDWYLYEAKILPSQLSGMNTGDALKTFVKYEFTTSGAENVWIDDVRIQPMDAQATAYVYDVVTHRLITTFDDQHFGLFYQYNAEGKLVRKLIETEKGMKTVQETQYNTPKITR